MHNNNRKAKTSDLWYAFILIDLGILCIRDQTFVQGSGLYVGGQNVALFGLGIVAVGIGYLCYFLNDFLSMTGRISGVAKLFVFGIFIFSFYAILHIAVFAQWYHSYGITFAIFTLCFLIYLISNDIGTIV
jgi:hypothetical protein